ncbi:hypothetical protein AB4Z29_00245 [Paenibacillus sp. 2TAB23]|uniref:ORC-CDC6 family AAA ATPase n=1 Tax=Paenibacillus sp. 2TAB23 TaxID=3233004 RepID=UPI003F9DC0E2
MLTPMTDREISKSISNIVKRSERQEDVALLKKSFTDDVGAYDQIDNNENQIIYGRRGTGKTHILKVLQTNKEPETNIIVHYIDLRTLGSTNSFTDKSRSISLRCYGLFKDLLGEVHNALLHHASGLNPDEVVVDFEELNKLAETVTNIMLKEQEVQFNRQEHIETTESDEGSLSVDLTQIGITLGGRDEIKRGKQTGASITAIPNYNFVIPDISSKVKKILENCKITKFYLLIDEWSTIDSEIQPFFAEFIKKTFLPLPRFVIKIAALEYRSKFFIKDTSGNFTGFELGGDISADVNLDDYYVYDKNPELVKMAFGKILFFHVSSQLPENYLQNNYDIKTWEVFVSKFFTSTQTFSEIVRAAEGVARDLIHIFNLSYFSSRSSSDKIDLKTVEQAARTWFLNDKESNLSENQNHILTKIVDDVIGHRKARSFLLEQQYGKDEMIRSLFDARVIHLMQKGYSDKDTRGVRFDIYSVDYGTYVHLKRTASQPELKLVFEEDLIQENSLSSRNTESPQQELILFEDGVPHSSEERIVPFDDKRSIRRVILTKEKLSIPNNPSS